MCSNPFIIDHDLSPPEAPTRCQPGSLSFHWFVSCYPNSPPPIRPLRYDIISSFLSFLSLKIVILGNCGLFVGKLKGNVEKIRSMFIVGFRNDIKIAS